MKNNFLFFLIVSSLNIIVACDNTVQISDKTDKSIEYLPTDPENQLDISLLEAFIPEVDQMQTINPCDPSPCASDELCELAQGIAVCQKKDCRNFTCAENETCVDSDNGPSCRSLLCQSDADCLLEEFCDQQHCVADTCVADHQRCDDLRIWKCSFNGAQEELVTTCDSLRSECVSVDQNNAIALVLMIGIVQIIWFVRMAYVWVRLDPLNVDYLLFLLLNHCLNLNLFGVGPFLHLPL